MRGYFLNGPGWKAMFGVSTLLLLLCMGTSGRADVLLRNGTLKTDPSAPRLAAAPSSQAGALRIYSFDHPLSPAERSALVSQGIIPLRYLPDNSWICRVTSLEKRVEPASSESSKTVEPIWQGEYLPEYKLLKSITDVPGWNLSGTPLKIRVLVARDASEESLAAIGKSIHAQGKPSLHASGVFLNGSATGAVLEALSQNPDVLWVEPSAKPRLLGEVAAKILEGENASAHPTYTQSLGYDGTGVVTAVADTGMDSGDLERLHPDLAGHIKALYFYGDVDSAMDEHGHGTHVAGSVVASGLRGTGTVNEEEVLYGLGTAPGAELVAQRIIDKTGTLFLSEDFQLLARDAYREGVSVVNNSWGAEESGRYDSYAAEYDALVRDADNLAEGDQEMAFVFAAGNSGPGTQTLITPGVGKNVITVGASQSDRQVMYIYEDGVDAMADFSSRGPTEDGRYKPDIVGPGTWISSTKSSCAAEGNEWLGIDDNYTYMGGTSMASPLMTGTAAVVIQYFRQQCDGQNPSPALLKALLIAAAQDMDDEHGTTPAPNFDEGWGRVSLTEMIQNPATPAEERDRIFLCENQSVLLKQGDEWERKVFVRGNQQELRITLAYTDVPALPSAIPALVNDLDLWVEAPDGTLFSGNQFLKGQSVSGATPDRINNVEGFLMENPMPGMYSIKVQAYRVSEDSRTDTEEIDQDFALVIAGDLAIETEKNLICVKGSDSIPLPREGLLFTDRNFYTAPDVVKVTLYDPDLKGQESVSVHVTSGTWPQGRELALSALGDSGFSGTLKTSVALDNPSPEEDVLPVADGDEILVTYLDAYPEGSVSVKALVDLVPPVVSTPESRFSYGKTTVSVETDTLSRTKIQYGSKGDLIHQMGVETYEKEHEFVLFGLPEGEYFYFIEAVDQAGNVSVNDNEGKYFSFVVEKSASILLVDGVSTQSSGGEYGFDVTPAPLSGFTDPLDALGYQYEVWSLDEMGSLPLLEDLKAYHAVIWRVHDMNYLSLVSTSIIPPENLTAITDYVEGGGAFFLSSMEILSYGNATFQEKVLHVASYTEDTEVSHISGVSGNLIGNGVSADLDYSAFPRLSEFIELGPDLSDTVVVGEGAGAIFYGASGAVGVQYPLSVESTQTGRSVFLSFPIDAIPMEGESPNNRVEVFRRVLQFLCPGLDGYASLSFSDAAYTIPSLATIELADSDLASSESVVVKVSTDRDSEPRELSLSPTVYPGVFKGALTLREAGAPASSQYLRAAHGESLYAEYFDESRGKTEKIEVMIDTVAPTLSGTEIELDYMDGVVSWTTDEPSDSMVEFGETPFLGRSVYDGVYTVDHSITVTNLLVDRAYYFKVSSRDAARNTGVDDNGGQLFVFRTPTPLTAPWSDDFEAESSLWLALSDSSSLDWGSASVWERGIPSDSVRAVVPGAYSGQYCYGINLQGNPDDISIASLFSPAIYLEVGQQSTLSFMSAHHMVAEDDQVLLNAGELSITTDNGATWTTLYSWSDDSTYGSWEEVSVDLSKWAGQTVRFQWYYNFMALWSEQVPGWYLDDVAITSKPAEMTGMLRVSSNLSAAAWVLSSKDLPKTTYQGGGILDSKTILSGYTYTLNWEPVPWYTTPKSETEFFPEGRKSLSFEGIYTFADSNGNGLPDEWELYFFEALLTPGQDQRDSDQDGLSDHDEFFAGTDPLNPQSHLNLSLQGTDSLKLSWWGVKGKTYQLQRSQDLKTWEAVSDPIRPEADGKLSFPVSSDLAQGEPSVLYRLEMTP